MTTATILAEAERLGLKLRTDGSMIYFRPQHAANPEFLEAMRGCKPELIAYLRGHESDRVGPWQPQGNPRATFRAERLRRVVVEVRAGIRQSERLADAGGFLDVIDEHYVEIVAGMNLEHFPESELGVLSDLGSDDRTRDIRAIIHILKTRLPRSQISDQPSVRTQLRRGEEKLAEAIEEMKEGSARRNSLSLEKDQPEAPKKSRRWFKGLGQMAQGAALSLADIGLAAGFLQVPVSPETQTWGALVSTATGFGMIMNGIGELRGE